MNESTLVPREEMSDLDWLARNVHVWVEDWTHVRKCQVRHEARWMASLSPNAEYKDWRTKAQWLARRAELQNKPSWDGARKWANWLGQDEDGAWWYFSAKPKCQSRSFDEMCSGICADFAGAGEVLGDWRDTLERRPETSEMPSHINQPKQSAEIPECAEVKQFEQFVSAEDAKISIMQSDGDIKHFGGIIGRKLPPEEYAATTKKPAITPSKYTKTIHGVSLDVYDVLQAWGVSNPALQHLVKKALQCGQRGHKDNAQDLQDIIDSAIRAKELEC